MTYTKDTVQFQPIPTHPNFKDVTGTQYGRLTVIGFGGRDGTVSFWFCECECGNIVRVRAGQLQCGKTQSCGCLRVEVATISNTTHGMRDSPEYRIFAHAKDRCTNPNDKRWDDYGGRGIEFRFNSFEEFFAEIGERPGTKYHIDRIDNEGHYEVGNVRWCTHQESARNKRTSRRLTRDGRTQLLIEWAEELDVNPSAILYRLKSGQSEQDALTPPFKGKGVPTKNRLKQLSNRDCGCT